MATLPRGLETWFREDLPLTQPKLPETVEQLVRLDERMGTVGGDRWFVAAAAESVVRECQELGIA